MKESELNLCNSGLLSFLQESNSNDKTRSTELYFGMAFSKIKNIAA
jgi:hypothetical protein